MKLPNRLRPKNLFISFLSTIVIILLLHYLAKFWFDAEKHKLTPRVRSIYTHLSNTDWSTKSLMQLSTDQLKQKMTRHPQITDILQDSMRTLGPVLSYGPITIHNIAASYLVETTGMIKFKKTSRVVVTKLRKINNQWFLDSFNAYKPVKQKSAFGEDKITFTDEFGLGTLVFDLSDAGDYNDLAVYLDDAFNNTKYQLKYNPIVTNLYRRAAAKGDTSGMYNLGLQYYKGKRGVPIQYAKALHWYQAALDTKCASDAVFCDGKYCAAHDLALMYLHGNGVKKNLNKAKELFQQTATLYAAQNKGLLQWIIDNQAEQYAQHMLLSPGATNSADGAYQRTKNIELDIRDDCWN